VLRATLRQNRHDFTAALADLDAVLAADPRNGQAWLTRAVVLQVQGRPDEAAQSCARLALLASPLVTATCLADAMSASGNADKAQELLERAVQRSPAQDVDVQLWSLTVLAEIAARRDEAASAERYFQAALALGRRDAYLLGTYADFLLDHGRADEARQLLKDETRADPLLLRLALAEQASDDPNLPSHIQVLSDRFAASRLRGDKVHLREEARFQLHLIGNAQEALRLALENWATQRETWDVRIVLESALAAGDPAAAGDAIAWLRHTKLEDPGIDALLRKFDGGPT
jgi:tetratricopeptide (TPR) repeat protein